MKVIKEGAVQRICACDRDRRAAEKREFQVRGVELIQKLQKEVATLRIQIDKR
ncbi:MAG TPA: hypothetical protein PLK04_11860 [Bacillota bacterium]|nr:hypothetical protein [Bacillota bacterium]